MVPAITARDEMIAPAPGTPRTGPPDPSRHEVTVPAGTPVDVKTDPQGPGSAAAGRAARAAQGVPPGQVSAVRAVPAAPSPRRVPVAIQRGATTAAATHARPAIPVRRARRGRSVLRDGPPATGEQVARLVATVWVATVWVATVWMARGVVRTGPVPRTTTGRARTTAGAPMTSGAKAGRPTGAAPAAGATAVAPTPAVPTASARRTAGVLIEGSPVGAAGPIVSVPAAPGAVGPRRPRAGGERPPVATATTSPDGRDGGEPRTSEVVSAGRPSGPPPQATAAAGPIGVRHVARETIVRGGRTEALATGHLVGPGTTAPGTSGAGPIGGPDTVRRRVGGKGRMRPLRRGVSRGRPARAATGRSRLGMSNGRPVASAGTGRNRAGASSGPPVASAGTGRTLPGAGRGRVAARAGIATAATVATDPTGDGTAGIVGRPGTRVRRVERIDVRPTVVSGPSGARRRA